MLDGVERVRGSDVAGENEGAEVESIVGKTGVRDDGDVFFFSSRSRHTRSLCGWSSDVCSSDCESIDPMERMRTPRWELLLAVERHERCPMTGGQ